MEKIVNFFMSKSGHTPCTNQYSHLILENYVMIFQLHAASVYGTEASLGEPMSLLQVC